MRGGAWIACALLLLTASDLRGQSVLERSPNMSWGWTGTPGLLHFHTIHRFHVGEAPTRALGNVPTLLAAFSPRDRLLVGGNYSSSSVLVLGSQNEWEIFGRGAFGIPAPAASPLDGAVTLAYNTTAGSVDGELSLHAGLGRLRLSGAVRGFSNAFDTGDFGGAVAAGLNLPLTTHVALAGDAVLPLDPDDAESTAWSAALQTRIPFTPHSLSFQATNAGPTTLQGASMGTSLVRWGFEFTVPFDPSRLRRPAPAAPDEDDEVPHDALLAELERNTVVVIVEEMQFGMEKIVVPAGSRVVWINRDPVAHTATAEDGSWDSGLIDQGESWSRVFREPGEFPFICTPHPDMTGVIVVEP